LHRTYLLLLLATMMTAACTANGSSGPNIRVEDAWARPADMGSMDQAGGMPMMSGKGANSALYFVIVNDGNQKDTLVGVSSEIAASAELHETRVEKDVAKMTSLTRLDIPAHGRVVFAPGGYHVMLIGVTQNLNEGDTINVTLYFEKSGAVALKVPVRLE